VKTLYDPFNSNWAGYMRTIEAAAMPLRLAVNSVGISTAEEIVHHVEIFAREPGGTLIVLPSGLMSANRSLLSELGIRHRLPVMYP
jgi:hypothetical protein